MFYSYAQNGEDVLLKRCFGHLPTGTYIDVGSSEPSRHSVTYALYLAGWSGIAIEPLPERFVELEALRPRDLNLCCALGELPGRTTLYRSSGRGGTSTIDPVAGKAMAARNAGVSELDVEVRTLSSVCREHLTGRSRYEILKLDVEGAEGLVLKGADFSSFRPEVLIAEAPAEPQAWEALLADAGYVPAAYDGVNKWYVCRSRDDLRELLHCPVNVHDDFQRVDQLGSAFMNPLHPDHVWAASFGNALARALTVVSEDALVDAYLFGVPPWSQQRAASRKDYVALSRRILGRRPTTDECGSFEKRRAVTVRTIVDELVRSDEFLSRRGRVIASI